MEFSQKNPFLELRIRQTETKQIAKASPPMARKLARIDAIQNSIGISLGHRNQKSRATVHELRWCDERRGKS
jgi:hypothetical protein